ncbi:MAG: hypothetical protein RBT69_02945 [Spirochaetia bacterium]|jgi:uncharacterized membrane protein YczE|nr:hypothetical protein [Spirochaetia bacterium]
MIKIFNRLAKLLLGLFLYSLGIVFTIRANIGYAPWDVFHAGLNKTFGITMGSASIIVGAVLVVITVLMGEKIGLGTLLNMVLIGVFLDILLNITLIPVMKNWLAGLALMIAGLFVISIASYFYIGSGFGAGPRDSLMVALTRKTGLPVGFCRGTIELSAVIIGWLLGGMAGVGTVISGFAIGFCIQLTFSLLKFKPTKIKHATLWNTFKDL